MNTERTYLENKSKVLETSTNLVDNPEYTETNEKLDRTYQEKTNCIRIRSKCDWYKHGEKYSFFFLNLEKPLQRKIKSENYDR